MKLRDVGQAMDFGVSWDKKTSTVIIESNKPYFQDTTTPLSDNPNAYTPEISSIDEVLRLVNEERLNNGLEKLTLDTKLCLAAEARSKEQIAVFSHTRPNGSSCFTILDEYNISYNACAENIAYGYNTPSQVVTGWLNSDGHRKNILNSNYNKIGIGCYDDNGVKYWTQIFTN